MARWRPVLIALVAAGILAGVVWSARTLWMRTTAVIPDAGISGDLAERRARRVSDLRYGVTLRVPADRAQPVTGRVVVTFDLRDATADLALDFAAPADHLIAARAQGRAFQPVIGNGHVVVPARRLLEGPNTLELDFVATDPALNRSDDLIYSLFVPARASSVLPCFDQPDLKARWQLSLDVPPGWTAVSNGRQSGRAETTGHSSLIFDETEPLPTYLFAFAAGRFTVETATRAGRTFRVFHRETDAARVERNLDAIVDQHARALAWMERYTGIDYPFGTFDVVLIPAFQFTGMEHPGAIYYRADALLLDETATQNEQLDRANAIAHETAHMWFGNLVTMRWFDDVWMKEVFANFYAAKIVNPSFPGMDHELRFLLQHYPAAYAVDRTAGANAIRQELDNLSDAGLLYGPIIYDKAPIVMRQLERIAGAEVFRAAVRDYLQAHRYGNAGWPEFVRSLDVRSSIDVGAWSRAWVTEAGRPTIATRVSLERRAIASLSLVESDPRGRGLVWPERLTVVLGWADGSTRDIDVRIEAPETAVPQATGLPAPAWILPAGGGLGYGRFEIDAASRDALLAGLHRIGNPLTRGAALVVLWDEMLEGQVEPAALLDTLVRAIPAERDELDLQQMLGYLRQVFWRFTPDDGRMAIAERIEPILRKGLAGARTTTARAAWFSTLRSVASTTDTIEWLAAIWRRDDAIDGLPLSENDEIDLALGLAVRDVPDAEAMLDAQLARTTNPDRRSRLAFIRPAVSADPAVRRAFFDSLADPAARAREAWVIDAMRYLNHPLRAAASRPLVVPALQLVREIQQTGDIFFPARWVDALLGGYHDAATAADVEGFLASLPSDYPRRLRWVIEAAADPLQRAARILDRPADAE